MECEQRNAIVRQHVEHAQPALYRLLRIAVIGELGARLLGEQNLMMRDVACEGETRLVQLDEVDRMPDGVTGRTHRLDSRQHWFAVRNPCDPPLVGQKVIACVLDEGAEVLVRKLLLVGPEIIVGLGNVDRCIGEQPLARGARKTPDVIDMGVRADDIVDLTRLDPRLPKIRQQFPRRGAECLREAHAAVEHDETVSGVEHENVLFEHHTIGREEVVGERLVDVRFRHPLHRIRGFAERQRPIRDYGCLELAEREPIEIRRL